VRIAAVQMASGPRVESNLKEAAWLIEMAAEQGARLVALPEYFGIMGLKDTDPVLPRGHRAQVWPLADRRLGAPGGLEPGQGAQHQPGL